jgi:hypothetical protein
MLSRKQIIVLLVLLACQIIFLCGFVFLRQIDYDEGAYLSAAYLVREGKLPYLDFFYPQMPYLPYLYALVSPYGFSSLYYGRIISSALGIFLSVLIFWFSYRLFKDERLSLFLLFLYGFNGLTLSWHSVVKTLAPSDLFGFISFIFFTFYLLSKEKKINLFWAGFLIGIAFNLRLTFLLVFLVEAIMIFILLPQKNLKRKAMDLAWLVFAAVLASAWAIYLFFKNPEAFLFGNIGFHYVWGQKVVKMAFFEKLYTLSKFIFSPQNLFILICAAFSTVWLVKKLIRLDKPTSEDKIIIFALSIGLVIIITSFFVSPTVFQYYEQVLPYLLFSSVPVLKRIISKWKDKKRLLPGFIIFYLLSCLPFIIVFIFVVRPGQVSYRIDKTKEVVKVVKQNSLPGEVILSDWPGYVVLSERETVPGMSTFEWWVIQALPPEEMENYKILSSHKISEMISAREPDMIIESEWFLSNFSELIAANYELVKTFQYPRVYVKIYTKEKPRDRN